MCSGAESRRWGVKPWARARRRRGHEQSTYSEWDPARILGAMVAIDLGRTDYLEGSSSVIAWEIKKWSDAHQTIQTYVLE